ncbi:hypothetical protein AMAG_05157 [Allomyces macrogynus ATCC 38327]|uniref:Major facilitator superfamily (MFS) profile domain-containing protein n=1 Tax=Allomyces macrogynus (strain ATCC 38327) TaxID=578462 RepID=A0A0L0SBB2_ALLM3|nr:hypothetical protein AMAG_05157 [Allomyces macrogynus ATCC 38327]|eukprot:KNE59694.1 hypothetical protein AMAG_05157 [Allomyces macrogynus ATCC 38327]
MIVGLLLITIASPTLALPQSFGVCVVVFVILGLILQIAMTPPLPDMGDVVVRKHPAASGQVFACFNVAFADPIMSSLLYEASGLIASMGLFLGTTVLVIVLSEWYYCKYYLRQVQSESGMPEIALTNV